MRDGACRRCLSVLAAILAVLQQLLSAMHVLRVAQVPAHHSMCAVVSIISEIVGDSVAD